ncbi:MAG TPA: hypothetical protein VHI71_00755 [Actinomycetota bacterium]|nr:hypothetical protein [Actinomycetota bacterium]
MAAPDSAETTPARRAEESRRLDSAATWLAGSFSVVTAVLTGVGATGGTLARMLRNHSAQARVGFALAALAIVMAGFSKSFFVPDPTFPHLAKWRLTRRRIHPLVLGIVGGSQDALQRRLLFLGSVSFALGLLIVTDAAARTPADDERPAITARFDVTRRATLLTGTVRAGGLKSSSVVHAIVTGFTPNPAPNAGSESKPTRLFEARSGPNSEGVVTIGLNIHVPRGVYDHVAIVAAPQDAEEEVKECTTTKEAKQERACLILKTPDVPNRPQIAASWDLSDDEPALNLAVAGQGLRHTQAIAVVVEGKRAVGPSLTLYRAVLAPRAAGLLVRRFTLPVPQELDAVCVAAVAFDTQAMEAARSGHQAPACPPGATARTTWTRLAVAEDG